MFEKVPKDIKNAVKRKRKFTLPVTSRCFSKESIHGAEEFKVFILVTKNVFIYECSNCVLIDVFFLYHKSVFYVF